MKTETLIKKIEAAGFKPRSYSGRGMYGAHCVGVSVQATRTGNADDLPEPDRVDSLGLGEIWYWPQCTWPEGVESDD